jgi:cytochrome c551/c552
MRFPYAIAAAVATVALSGPAFAGKGEDLIEANACGKCHTATSTKKAPSFASIAEKNKGNADAQAKMVQMLKTGGTDDHKTIKASDDDLKAVVAVVMSAK